VKKAHESISKPPVQKISQSKNSDSDDDLGGWND